MKHGYIAMEESNRTNAWACEISQLVIARSYTSKWSLIRLQNLITTVSESAVTKHENELCEKDYSGALDFSTLNSG
jgi:hypothetical protein